MESIHMLAQTSTLTIRLAMDLLVRSHLLIPVREIVKLAVIAACLTSSTFRTVEVVMLRLKGKQAKSKNRLEPFESCGFIRN